MPKHIKLDYWVCDKYPWGCNIHHDTEEQAKNCSCNKYTAQRVKEYLDVRNVICLLIEI